jgi:hypothetical protein
MCLRIRVRQHTQSTILTDKEISMVIHGQRYTAYNVQSTTWMVKRWINPNAKDEDQDYTECLFSTDLTDEKDVIELAIRNDSWA